MTRLKLAAGDTFRSLHTRNFRLFFTGQVVSQTGTWMEMVAVVWLVLRLTDSGIALGLVTATQFLPMLVLGAWAGLLADRFDRHRFMLITQVTFAAVASVLAVLVVLDAYNVVTLYVFSAMFGLITALDNPNRRALVNDLVARDEVANAVGLNSAIMTGSRVVGPTVAGLLIAGPGVAWCFVLNAVSYLAVITALTRMDRSAFRSSPKVAKAKGQLREGFAYVRRTPELALPLVLVAVIGTLAFNYPVTLPLLAERSLGGDATTFTLLYSTMSVGAVMGALQVARRRLMTIGLLVRAAFGLAAATTALALSPSLLVALPAAVASGFFAISLISGSNALVQVQADPAMRGRVLAMFSMVFLGSTPIGGPIIGFVSETLNPRTGLLVGAVAATVVAVWTSRRVRHLPPMVRGLLTPSPATSTPEAKGSAPDPALTTV
jgi:MFS family permease